MNTQVNEVTITFVEKFEAYVTDSKSMGELKARLEDARKILEPVIRAHRIPIEPKAENVKAWKAKREIFFPLVQELEWPREEQGEKMEKDNISATEIKRMDARIVAWLGVIKTCLELQILPTDKNADRLRKARVWTGLNGNGKVNPNWVDPKAKKPETAAPATAAPATAAPATAAPATAAPATTLKAVSVKATTPQKQTETIHPLTSNVSSSDAAISPREHFGILFDQMLKNETFRGEYVEVLACMLEVDKSTLTRCMVQARDTIK